jgi:hypothetical protein
MTETPDPSEQPEIQPSGTPPSPIETEPETDDDPTDPNGLWRTLPLSR